MQKEYSTCIIPDNSRDLLFSIKSNTHLHHCWFNEDVNTFIVLKESCDFADTTATQILNFNKQELKIYLLESTLELKNVENCLIFNEVLWEKYME